MLERAQGLGGVGSHVSLRLIELDDLSKLFSSLSICLSSYRTETKMTASTPRLKDVK